MTLYSICTVLKLLCFALMPHGYLCARPRESTVHGRGNSHAKRQECGDAAPSRSTPVLQNVKKGVQHKCVSACSQYLMQRSVQRRILACTVPATMVSAHVHNRRELHVKQIAECEPGLTAICSTGQDVQEWPGVPAAQPLLAHEPAHSSPRLTSHGPQHTHSASQMQ